MASDWTQSTRALKAVVIVLGALIVIAVAVVAVELFRRAGTPAARSLESLASNTVALDPGERVVAMTAEGDALSLLVEDAEGRQRVVTVDRRSGAVLGTLTLVPAARQ
ncbi:MAG: hypothetical protein V3R74_05200 [Alphaproteobacteria bacterium]